MRRSVKICQRRSRRRANKQVPAQRITTPRQLFFMVGYDAVEPMPAAIKGNKYLTGSSGLPD